ncbi:MAG: HEAT repeat domain-containing protein [Myxococcota bacterium]
MFLFLLISMVCAVVVPGVLLYFASNLVVGPLLWAGRSLRLTEQRQRSLAAGKQWGLNPTTDPQHTALLNRVALTSWSPRARDFFGEIDGLRVLMRTQPRTVGPDGEPLRFPWTRKERSEAQRVLGLWLVVDARELLSGIDLHVALGRDDSVVGDEALAVALLDGDMRKVGCPGDQLTISEGLVGYDAPLGIHRGRPEAVIEQLIRMTNRMLTATRGIDRARLLLENIKNDANADVRAQSADMLLCRFPETTDITFETALRDPAPAVRFAAARHLNPADGFGYVFDVLKDSSAGDGLRERALRYMIRHFSTQQILPVLEGLVLRGQGSLRNIGVRHLGELKHKPAVGWFSQIVATSDTRTLVDIATSLADIDAPGAEPILLKLLLDPNIDVQLAAVDALGSVGHLTSVQRLLPLSKSRLTDARLQLAASTAVRMIQSRSSGTGSGALSMVEDAPTGRVSMARDSSKK